MRPAKAQVQDRCSPAFTHMHPCMQLTHMQNQVHMHDTHEDTCSEPLALQDQPATCSHPFTVLTQRQQLAILGQPGVPVMGTAGTAFPTDREATNGRCGQLSRSLGVQSGQDTGRACVACCLFCPVLPCMSPAPPVPATLPGRPQS